MHKDYQELLDNSGYVADRPKPYHELHVSEILQFQKCKRSHDYKYNGKWYAPVASKPLEFGTCMHTGYEVFFDTGDITTATKATLAVINEQRAVALANDRNFFSEDTSTIDEYNQRILDAADILKYYAENISPELDADYETLATEFNFAVPIQNAVCYCSDCLDYSPLYGRPVYLEGTIDWIGIHKPSGRVRIRDWKNVARISMDYEWLEIDPQMNAYFWAATQLGFNVSAFEYHEQLSSPPRPPEPLAKKYKGKSFSTSKTNVTTYDMFFETVKREDHDALMAGEYNEYLKWLRDFGPTIYHREVFRPGERAQEGISRWLTSAAQGITETRAFNEVDNAYLIIPAPSKWNCKYCEFLTPCIEKFQGRDDKDVLEAMFEQREGHYYDDRTKR